MLEIPGGVEIHRGTNCILSVYLKVSEQILQTIKLFLCV